MSILKCFSVAVLSMMAVSSFGANEDNCLTIENLSAPRGGRIVLPVNMENQNDIAAFSFDLYLPDGIAVATTSTGKLDVRNTNRAEDQSLSPNYKDDYYSIASLSVTSSPYSGTTGSICDIVLELSPELELRDYTIDIKNIVLATPNNEKYKPSNISCTITVNDGPIYAEGYSLEIAPFSAKSLFSMNVELNSLTDIASLSFEVGISDGFSLISSSIIASCLNNQDFVGFFSSNLSGTVFSGNSAVAALVYIKQGKNQIVTLSGKYDNLTVGIYQVSLKNIVLTDVNGEKYFVAPYTADIYVGATTPTATPDAHGVVAYHGNYSSSEAMALLNASLPDEGVNAIDLNAVTSAQGQKIEPKNPNTLILEKSDLGLTNEQNVVMLGEENTCANLVITDGNAFQNNIEFKAAKASYTRTMSEHKWGTLCLPFEVEPNETAKVYQMTAVSDGVMTFSPVVSSAAYNPCIIKKLSTDDKITFTAENATIAVTPEAMSVVTGQTGWTLVGTMAAESFDGNASSSLYFINGDLFWKAGTSGLNVASFRAYFETTTSNGAKFRIEEGTSGIEAIEADVKQTPVYNLQGNVVSKTQRGQVYIKDNVKYIIK